MSQFGGGSGAGGPGGGNKNQPWQQPRGPNPGAPHPSSQSLELPPGLMNFSTAPPGQAGPGVFQQNSLLTLGGAHNPSVTLGMVAAGQQGTISYPRPLGPPFAGGNPAQQIIQQQQAAAAAVGVSLHQPQQNAHHGPPAPGQSTQRVFTGTVTKLLDNFGFVDEDVFFQTAVVKGQTPRVNDRVLVEASYNPNMPFKWNASRIQTLPHQGRGVNSGPPPNNPPNSNNINNFVGNQPGVGHNIMNKNLPPAGSGGMRHDNNFAGGNRDHNRGGRGIDQPTHPAHPNHPTHPNHPNHPNNPNHQHPNHQHPNHHHPNHPHPNHPHPNNPNHGGRSSPIRGGGRNEKPDNSRPGDRDRRRDESRSVGPSNRDRERSRDKDRSAGNVNRSTGNFPILTPSPSIAKKRSHSPHRKTRSRSRSRSPPRRRPRTTPRYHVSIPKVIQAYPENTVIELKKKFSNM